ncbi:MAG: HNH endonuclease [Betaproteobacteria bacterium]|nr:HNH endonuclease [Betaproteobacteria bacterium]
MIRRRDQTCRYCGGAAAGAGGAIDHLLPRRLFPHGQGDFPDNLALLCVEHHAVKTSIIEPALYRGDYLAFSMFLDRIRISGPVPCADAIGDALAKLRQLLEGQPVSRGGRMTRLDGRLRYQGVAHKCRKCGRNHKTRAHGKKGQK